MKLRDYQEEAIKVINGLPDGSRSICCLATGLGKTVVAANIEAKGRILWLSHRDELVHQPERYFVQNNMTFGIEKAEQHAENENVVSASVQTLSRDNRLQAYDPEEFDIIICDEAHHAAARSYKKVLNYFRPRKLIGLTATPKRGDNIRLTDVFDSICFTRDLRWGIENGYLSRIRCVRVVADYDMDKLKKVMGDFTASGLDEEMKKSNTDMAVAKAYLDYCYPFERQTIIYCPTVDICELTLRTMRKALPEESSGTIEMLSDRTPPEERRRILQDYRDKKVKAIINCMILTEGTDLPETSCIINNRPTSNDSLYQQIIGRGTRRCDGKDYCLIIDVEGRNARKKSICTAPTLFGLEPDQLPEAVRNSIDEKVDLLEFSDDIIEKRANMAKDLVLHKYILNMIYDDYMSIITDNAEQGCPAIARAYRQHEDDKFSDDDMNIGDIYARKMYDDEHYLRIRATFNGLIYMSRQDILGNTVIDCYIPANETLDKKEISFVSDPMPVKDAEEIVKKILRYMISPYYKSSWSKKERESLSEIRCTGKQWGLVCHEYEKYCAKPRVLSMLDANDLIELKKDIAEIVARENIAKKENGSLFLCRMSETYTTEEENLENFMSVKMRISEREEKEKELLEDIGKTKSFVFAPDQRGMHNSAPLTEKQDMYIQSLISGLYKNGIVPDKDFKYDPSEWSKGSAGMMIGYLKTASDKLKMTVQEPYGIELDISKAQVDMKNVLKTCLASRRTQIVCDYKIVRLDE